MKRIVFLVDTKAPTGIFSKKTALVKAMNDLVLNVDKRKSSFCIGLDLSAAFDTLDHQLLLSILETKLRFEDRVLSFLNSYLTSQSSIQTKDETKI